MRKHYRKCVGVDVPTTYRLLPSNRGVISYVDTNDTRWVNRNGEPSYVGLEFQQKTIHAETFAHTVRVSRFTSLSPDVVVRMIQDSVRSIAQHLAIRHRVADNTGIEMEFDTTYDATHMRFHCNTWPTVPCVTVPPVDRWDI